MKNLIPLLGFFLIANAFTSCKSDAEKNVEIVTDDYVRFVDSITDKTTLDARQNWKSIEKSFEKKSDELNLVMDNLEDNASFDARIDSATEKFEAFRNSIFKQTVQPDSEIFFGE